MNKVVVIGSLNLDIIQNIKRLPLQGETLRIDERSMNLGGKGANQAVAAARQGAEVSFIGAIGKDEAGQQFKSLLEDEGINVSGLREKDTATGSATILLEEDGHNTILVYGGANAELSADDVVMSEALIADADYVVAQFEVPQEAVAKGFYLAKKYGVKTVLNPAPVMNAKDIDPAILACTDIIVPNETEAAALLEREPSTKYEDLLAVSDAISELSVQGTIITLGEDGVYYNLDGKNPHTRPIFKVKAVDTTAAGDTFIGAVVSQLKLDATNVADAVEYACKASSLAVSRSGAIRSIPTHSEVVRSLHNED
ncbi:ribokinase [Weissella confusa]|uniref:ribokinase n=2 Tax=Weissella confusa TaxID=1583 RepID=UPI000989A79A|nr:ribokinase [Weissella confusa]MBJ7618964.1 ribokinase [Weissella confusa]MBJ7624364.1 ribokinase [Weissella confusa]MBJ7658180.1 ribokinase [Weissella confusa]MBJ7666114.1 ribokinase [Weissella confusa]MBJ7675848.1 ribokinase [Weissella confusa]